MSDQQKKMDGSRTEGMEKVLHSARRKAFAQATRQGSVWILELAFFACAQASRHSVYLSYETEWEALAGMRSMLVALGLGVDDPKLRQIVAEGGLYQQGRKVRLFRVEEFAQHYNL